MPRKAAASTPPEPAAQQTWFVYLLLCRNGRLYTGVTVDLAARFELHRSGKGAMFTRINKPERMLAATPCEGRSAALKLEARIKRLAAPEKRALAARWDLQKPLA